MKLGLNPAVAARTGIIGTVDTPGTAVDVCAFNNIVAVADSSSGVSIFNVFNRMDPLIIAQVPTLGPAVAVAISGNFLIAAHGASGVTILDISHPPDVPVVYQGSVGGTAQAVAASGDYAFVGTVEGAVTMIELSSSAALQTIQLGGRVEDLGIEGDTLYAYANGKLQIIPVGQGILAVSGSLASPAPSGINAANGRGRIFVGGGVAYLVHTRGYNAFSVTNPAAPVLLLQGNAVPNQFGWKQIALNGSGLMLGAVSPNQAFDGPHNLSLFTLNNPSVFATFQTEFVTPGVARSVALYNGLAYVADNTAGLQVIAYKETDFLGRPPTGTLICTATNGTNGFIVEGTQVFFRAAVADDVQVRNVEFYVDGVKAATDGNFPFEFGWRPPPNSAGKTFKFTAVASDTGGNTTNLTAITLSITPDTQPPTVAVNSPSAGQVLYDDDAVLVRLTVFDNVGIASLTFFVDGIEVSATRISLTGWRIASLASLGNHTLSVIATDYAGNTSSTMQAFVIRQVLWSREMAVLNSQPEPRPSVLSKEISVLVMQTETSNKTNIFSREKSVNNQHP